MTEKTRQHIRLLKIRYIHRLLKELAESPYESSEEDIAKLHRDLERLEKDEEY